MSSEASNRPSSEARIVHTEDALAWLRAHAPIPGASLVASLPDYSEFPGLSLGEWKSWFTDAASLVLASTPDEGVAIFFQSDIKHEGEWIDKSYLVQRAAEASGHALLFHKVLCRAAPGATTFGKPAYSHLLAFSRTVRPPAERSTADVIPDLGDKAWVRGMGFAACRIAVDLVVRETPTRTIVNPFCGYGSVLAAANAAGLRAVGIERSPKRADRARRLRVNAAGDGFAELDERPAETITGA
ncbi:MAG: hypothetical protein JST04_00610 [Bdellovibrionales bacterium]|nr:hypothetical protein [Bdellovibrionales bacterium]